MPPVQARKSYTAAFKLEVIKYAEENSNRAAEREFGINEKKCPYAGANKDILHKTKKSQKAFRTKAPFWPELENELESFVLE
jgi:hypothetical protein